MFALKVLSSLQPVGLVRGSNAALVSIGFSRVLDIQVHLLYPVPGLGVPLSIGLRVRQDKRQIDGFFWIIRRGSVLRVLLFFLLLPKSVVFEGSVRDQLWI